jgi:hypothetical protein
MIAEQSVTLIELERSITADPASVTLLLSGPAAGELWRDVVDVTSTAGRIAFGIRGDRLRALAGTLALQYASPVHDVPSTRGPICNCHGATAARPAQPARVAQSGLRPSRDSKDDRHLPWGMSHRCCSPWT